MSKTTSKSPHWKQCGLFAFNQNHATKPGHPQPGRPQQPTQPQAPPGSRANPPQHRW